MLCAAALVAASLGCQSPAPVNRPIDTWDESVAAASDVMLSSPERSGRVLLALTFSGGGTRAAAFAYGVLQELAETRVRLDGRARRLLDEIDLISSVSGGSFTSAYFGLHGDGIFDDYEEVFLRRNVQRGLVFEVLRPRYWLGILGVDRSQLAARYYDRKIFEGATFANLRRPGAPQIIINATDLSTAGRFPFMPYTFGALCSDLPSYPVADAVTASSAVPIVFPTVRLQSYAGTCGFEPPEWAHAPAAAGERDLRDILRSEIRATNDAMREREFVHLLDGGLSDNLGLANGVAAIAATGDPAQALQSLGYQSLELILVVTVNAEPETERPWNHANKAASPVQVVSGLTGAQMSEHNRLTVKLARAAFGQLAEDLSTPAKPVRFRYVEVSFAEVPDPEERKYLRGIETSFHLSDKKVDRLIEAARQLVRESPELAEALALVNEADADR
jgi:NTE family protein